MRSSWQNGEPLVSVEIVPKQPFRLDLTVWALRRAPVNEVDRWDGVFYRRVVEIDGEPVELRVGPARPEERLRVSPAVRGGARRGGGDPAGEGTIDSERNSSERGAANPGNRKLRVVVTEGRNGTSTARPADRAVVEMVTATLGVDADLTSFYRLATRDERLGLLVSRFEGLKPPRFFTPFEGIVNGIACQQLSVAAGIHLLNRLCRTHGPRLDDAAGFPSPDVLAKVDPESLRSLGFSRRKAESIVSIARSVVLGELDLEGLHQLDNASVEQVLRRVKGIGRWTAQYVALRGLGRWDVFPVDDVGGQNKVKEWLGLTARPDAAQMERLLAPYEPFRGLIYFHLLLHQLAVAGSVKV